MSDPFDCYDKLDFNTRKLPLYSHVIKRFPKSNEPETVVRLCRCWQSHKFPYCDDTHRLLVEAGDDVGPFVARLRSDNTGKKRFVKLRQMEHVPRALSSSVLQLVASPGSAVLIQYLLGLSSLVQRGRSVVIFDKLYDHIEHKDLLISAESIQYCLKLLICFVI